MNISILEYYKLLESHDWTYRYSDDFFAWERGEKESETLERIAKTEPVFRWYLNQFILHFWKGTPKPARPEED